MTDKENALYHQIRNVSGEKSLVAAKAAMSAASEKRFRAFSQARQRSMAQVAPIHDAMRKAIAAEAQFAGVNKALSAGKIRPVPANLPPLTIPPGPKVPRLKLGSFHLVDVPPFQPLTWQSVQIYGGDQNVSEVVSSLSADGNTGDMSFNISGGGALADNSSSVSCWAAIGQTYTVPEGSGKSETGGVSMTFSASPSFNWNAQWGSGLYRLASGEIWIGQVVNQFDADWTLIGTPVSYQIDLQSWNDYNFADNQNESGETSAFGLSTQVFALPGFYYNCWVWIGANAFGDWVDSGWSFSNPSMTANVPSLTFDAL
jgi:hypothetical protein